MLTTRKVSIAVLVLASSGLAACGESSSASASQEDLQRDLQLASATTMNLAAPRVDSSLLTRMETTPQGTLEVSRTVKKGPGPRAVRSETPTVLATPDVDVAAVEETEDVQTQSIAPTPEPTPEPVAVAPRPEPVAIPATNGGDYGSGGGIFGGAGAGGGRGVVIRGGGVDGDNCELHRRPRGGTTSTGPVYIPRPTAQPGGVTVGGGRTARGAIGSTMRPSPSGTASGARSSVRARRG